MVKKGAKQSKPKKQQQPQHQQQEQQQKQEKKEELPDKFSLYVFMELENKSKSTPQEIRKQYKKLVVRYHPDKNNSNEQSREKFQKLKQAYDILIDQEKKKLYDETGSIGDQFNENAFQSAYQYYRSIYKKIEEEDIIEFEKKYRHYQMQQQDLLNFYEKKQGNMITLLQSIPLSSNQDIPRFIQFFSQKIKAKQIKNYSNFEKTKAKVRLLVDQTEEFEEQQQQKKKKDKSDMNSLILAIKNKNNNQGFLNSLQKKYCQPVAPKKKRVEKASKDGEKREKKTKK